jgi:hypothetical protein
MGSIFKFTVSVEVDEYDAIIPIAIIATITPMIMPFFFIEGFAKFCLKNLFQIVVRLSSKQVHKFCYCSVDRTFLKGCV